VGKTLLIVDSHVASRRMLSFALEMQGHCIIDVADRSAAHAVLTANRVDLLVIGFNAEEDENAALVAHVRQRKDLSELPILLVGSSHRRELHDLWATGNCAWLDKPLRLGEVHSAVESLLGGSPLPAAR